MFWEADTTDKTDYTPLRSTCRADFACHSVFYRVFWLHFPLVLPLREPPILPRKGVKTHSSSLIFETPSRSHKNLFIFTQTLYSNIEGTFHVVIFE